LRATGEDSLDQKLRGFGGFLEGWKSVPIKAVQTTAAFKFANIPFLESSAAGK